MEFTKLEECSINRDGFFYQISQGESVHYSYSNAKVTWMKGNNRALRKFDYDTQFGVVGDSLFFEKGEVIKKAKLIDDHIVITDSVKIERGIKVYLQWKSLYYFIERDDNPNVSFAIPINEHYRSCDGIKFNVSIDELKECYQIHVHGNFLFCITNDGNSSSIRRYQSDSEEYLEKKELPKVYIGSVLFNNWIFYSTPERELISVDVNDLSYEIIKEDLKRCSNIVGIDEYGTVHIQSYWDKPPVALRSAKLPEKYRVNIPKSLNSNEKKIDELMKRVEELEKRLQAEQKEKEELLKAKTLLEKRLENQQKNGKEKKEEESINNNVNGTTGVKTE